MPEVTISLDFFPARVRTPDGGRHDPARAVISDDTLRVWMATRGKQPEVVYERPVLSIEGTRMTGYSVQVEDGSVTVVRAAGCGCGNPLRRFDPFNGATRLMARRS